MSYEQPLTERRNHVRVNARGAVVLRSGEREIHGRGVVVSRTSLEVHCQLGFALLSMAGRSVEIEMCLEGAETRFLAHGQVARIRAADHSLVIALGALPEALARLLDARIEVEPIEVLVIDFDRVRSAQISDAFRAEGCHVIEVTTSFAALDVLNDARFATDVIAVADTASERRAADLSFYLDSADTLVIRIGASSDSVARLDPSDPTMRSRVKSLLETRPWRAALETAGASTVIPDGPELS